MLQELAQYLDETRVKPDSIVVDGKTLINPGRWKEMEAFQELEKLNLERTRKEYQSITFPSPLAVTTLTGLTDYVLQNPDGFIQEDRKAIIQVESATSVKLFTQNTEIDRRAELITAQAITPKIQFGQLWDVEQCIITLQSQFAKTDDRDKLLSMISHVVDKESQEIKDDGFSQTVTVRKGAATVEAEKIPNPATLAPFRTFIEIEQPRSYYLVRMHDGNKLTITEADGGEWRIQAIASIKEWLEERLENVFSFVYILA